MSSKITFEKSTNNRSRAIQNNNLGSIVDNSNNTASIVNIDVDNDMDNSMLLEGNMGISDDSSSRLNIHNCYPITWLPLLQSNSETISIDNMNNSCNFPPGTIVQLPVSYSRDACNTSSISGSTNNNIMNGMKILGLVVGPNTMVPLQSFSLLGLDSYTKVEDSSLSMNANNLIDGENIIKIEIPNESIVNNAIAPDNEMMSQIHPECHRNVLNNEIDGNSSHLNCSPHNDDNFTNQISSQTQWYACEVCGKSFKDLIEIIKHTSSAHAITFKRPKCPHCELATKIDFGYILNDTSYHQLHHDRFAICQNCDKEFFYNIASLFHADSNYANIRFACKICGRTYKHNRDLRKHERTRHPDNISNSSCVNSDNVVLNEPLLSDRYPNKSNIYKETQPTVRLRCNLCEKFFRGPYELRRHVRSVHENRRPYSCQQCDKSFRDTYELKRHSSSHQRMASINTSHEASMEVSLASQNVASFLSNSHRHLADNSNSQHIDFDSRNSNNSVSLVVNDQAVQNSSNNSSNNMMMIDNFYCQVCDKNFRGANEFKRHLAVVHEKKYRYRCLHCSKFWRDQYDLKRHCRRSHCQDKEIDKDYLRQCLLDKSTVSHEQSRNEQNISLIDINSQEESRFHLNNYHNATVGSLNGSNSNITMSSNTYHNEDVLSNSINYSMDSNIMLCDSVVSQSPRTVNEIISQRSQNDGITHDHSVPISNEIVNHQTPSSNKISHCQSNNYLNQLPFQSSHYSNQAQMRNNFFNGNVNCNRLQVNFANGSTIPCNSFNSTVHSTINSDSIVTDSTIISSPVNTYSSKLVNDSNYIANNKPSNDNFLIVNESSKNFDLQLPTDPNQTNSLFNSNETEGDDNGWSFNRAAIRDRDLFINTSTVKGMARSPSSIKSHANS